MPFKQGQSGNPAGKPKGTRNKLQEKLRESISAFLSDEFPTVKEEFKKLEPRDKLKFYTDLLNYGLPKLQATSMDIKFDDLTDDQLDLLIDRLKNNDQ